MDWNSILTWVGVAGAVGTASMGLVEALKFAYLGPLTLATTGVGKVKAHLSPVAMTALGTVYGANAVETLLEGAWRKGPENLEKVLRNGLRMAVFAHLGNLKEFIAGFGQDAAEIAEAIELLKSGQEKSASGLTAATARERVSRLEAAIDARVQAAVAAGRDKYVAAMQFTASAIAVGGCVLFEALRDVKPPVEHEWGRAVLLGLAAVPVAPIAKDVATFLNGIRSAFQKSEARS